jgi:DMSO reductase anchor subunit
MGYRVGRRHADKLRRIALIGGVATLSLVMATPGFEGTAAIGWALLAAVTLSVSVLVERWLFFAEARHAVTLYYGEAAV